MPRLQEKLTHPMNPPKIETKSVKHVFTPPERESIGSQLAGTVGSLRGINAEFDQIKASFKARLAEAEARIDFLSTSLVNGFDMRNERCIVLYRPADRKKDYYLESTAAELAKAFENGTLPQVDATTVLTEDMTREDFQSELIQAESKFDAQETIDLFQPTETDFGRLVVGKFAGKWFAALRIKIGRMELTERMDSEQRSFKTRASAVQDYVLRAQVWLKENLREHAKGFEAALASVVEANREKV